MDYKEYCKEASKEMNYAKRWIGTKAANLMRKKISRTYDKLIDDFYSRAPEYYRRTDVDQYFQPNGINLYRALDEGEYGYNRKQYSPCVIDGDVGLSSNDMNGERYNIDKDIVLSYILNGTRFPSYQTEYGIYRPEMSFVTTYTDEECSASGTILEILESIKNQLSDKYIEMAKSEARKTLKLKYVSF